MTRMKPSFARLWRRLNYLSRLRIQKTKEKPRLAPSRSEEYKQSGGAAPVTVTPECESDVSPVLSNPAAELLPSRSLAGVVRLVGRVATTVLFYPVQRGRRRRRCRRDDDDDDDDELLQARSESSSSTPDGECARTHSHERSQLRVRSPTKRRADLSDDAQAIESRHAQARRHVHRRPEGVATRYDGDDDGTEDDDTGRRRCTCRRQFDAVRANSRTKRRLVVDDVVDVDAVAIATR